MLSPILAIVFVLRLSRNSDRYAPKQKNMAKPFFVLLMFRDVKVSLGSEHHYMRIEKAICHFYHTDLQVAIGLNLLISFSE